MCQTCSCEIAFCNKNIVNQNLQLLSMAPTFTYSPCIWAIVVLCRATLAWPIDFVVSTRLHMSWVKNIMERERMSYNVIVMSKQNPFRARSACRVGSVPSTRHWTKSMPGAMMKQPLSSYLLWTQYAQRMHNTCTICKHGWGWIFQ